MPAIAIGIAQQLGWALGFQFACLDMHCRRKMMSNDSFVQFDVSLRLSTEDGGFLDAAEFLYVAADQSPRFFFPPSFNELHILPSIHLKSPTNDFVKNLHHVTCLRVASLNSGKPLL